MKIINFVNGNGKYTAKFVGIFYSPSRLGKRESVLSVWVNDDDDDDG